MSFFRNRGHAHIELELYGSAIKDANSAIEYDGANTGAYLVKGRSQGGMADRLWVVGNFFLTAATTLSVPECELILTLLSSMPPAKRKREAVP